MYDMKTKLDQ